MEEYTDDLRSDTILSYQDPMGAHSSLPSINQVKDSTTKIYTCFEDEAIFHCSISLPMGLFEMIIHLQI